VSSVPVVPASSLCHQSHRTVQQRDAVLRVRINFTAGNKSNSCAHCELYVYVMTHCLSVCQPSLFLPHDAMLALFLLSSCVRLSARPSQAGIVRKRLDESSWLQAWRLPCTLCYKEMSFRHGKSFVLSTTLAIVVVVDCRVC